ncbi:MAG TPA: hypothetical protein VLA04_05600 [Verrucomicrobiae bacterium]|nr:hypothetical protein [Verrucomicrobiae bacterium]
MESIGTLTLFKHPKDYGGDGTLFTLARFKPAEMPLTEDAQRGLRLVGMCALVGMNLPKEILDTVAIVPEEDGERVNLIISSTLWEKIGLNPGVYGEWKSQAVALSRHIGFTIAGDTLHSVFRYTEGPADLQGWDHPFGLTIFKEPQKNNGDYWVCFCLYTEASNPNGASDAQQLVNNTLAYITRNTSRNVFIGDSLTRSFAPREGWIEHSFNCDERSFPLEANAMVAALNLQATLSGWEVLIK